MSLMERRRALMGQSGKELPILNPSVGYTENYRFDSTIAAPYLTEKDGALATDFIFAGTSGNFVYFNPNTRSLWNNSNSPYCGKLIQYNANKAKTDQWNCVMNGKEKSVALSTNKCYIRLALPFENLSGVYAYNSETGQIYYAGKDTPYYGKTNISEVTV